MTASDSPESLGIDDLNAIVDDPLTLEARDDVHLLIPALPAPTFVRIARHLHASNRLELLLPHATPDQLTSLLDLDGWVRDRIDIRRARVWLHAIARYAPLDKPRGYLADLLYAMDPELWTVALAAGTAVVELPADDDQARDIAYAQLGSLRTWESSDGFFVVGVPDDELGLQTLQTIQGIYDDDLSEGRKLCLAIASLLSAQAEEQLMHFRNGRLADLGFVAWDEAMKLLRPLDDRAAATHETIDFAHLQTTDQLTPPFRWDGPLLLRRVMMRLSPDEHGVRSREFLLLINEMISAQRFDPGDEAQQQRAIDQTQSTIAIGLEMLGRQTPAGMDVDAFLAERITAIGLRLMFRVGYGALDKVRNAALLLHRSGRVSLNAPGSLLDRPWGPAIASFVGLVPELPRRSGQGTHPMRSLADVAQATLWVAQAHALARLCFEADGYRIDPVWLSRVDHPERLRLGDLIRTAIVHTHLPGTNGVLAPLTAEDLRWAQHNLLGSSGLHESVRATFTKRCDQLNIGDHAAVLAENLLTRLIMELTGLELDDEGRVDLTRVGGMLTIQQVSVWLSLRHGHPAD